MSQLQICDVAGVGPAFLHALEHGKNISIQISERNTTHLERVIRSRLTELSRN